MTEKLGAFTFVLHSHIPYARMAGRWPHGEEWIHEAATETYLPLLIALRDLADEGVRFRLTIGITPVLAEQLADADVLANLETYIDELRVRAEHDAERFRGERSVRATAATFYAERFAWLLDRFRGRFGRDIIGAFRALQDEGYIEIATSCATHGYLPLLERDSALYAQVRTGVRAHERHFGRKPEAFWLPECAYRPAYTRDDGMWKPGVEEFLAEQGLRVFFTETHMILGGQPVGKAAGDALDPYADTAMRTLGDAPSADAASERTTFQPYWVASPRVAAMGRNDVTGTQVWSADYGYPGDFDYREFHKKDDDSGLQYWRVTGDGTDLADKAFWHPWRGFERTQEHAQHFAALVERQIAEYHARTGGFGIVCAAYDTELFGHWWFEGVGWLQNVLRILAASETVALSGAAEFVGAHPPVETVTLPEGSWGREGSHVTWHNGETQWMWPVINGAQWRMEQIVERQSAGASGIVREALNQLARELLLLESSDWPFLVTTGQAREYAELRFTQHVERFETLAAQVEAGSIDAAYLRDLQRRDNVFGDIDVDDFRAREGSAAPAAMPAP